MKIKIIIAFICLFAGIANAGVAAVKRTDYKSARTGVEYAISNNHGLISGNTYKGFSIDGNVEIWFYYNPSSGSIISFFPKVN